jgi:hypothetical protein
MDEEQERAALLAQVRQCFIRLGLPGPVVGDLLGAIEGFVSQSRSRSGGARAPTLAGVARGLYKSERLRAVELLPELPSHAARDMLVDLFAANQEGRRVSASGLCLAHGGVRAKAMRAIDTLQDMGLVQHSIDETGPLEWLECTRLGREAVLTLISALDQPSPAVIETRVSA